jgi:hypothetical protein
MRLPASGVENTKYAAFLLTLLVSAKGMFSGHVEAPLGITRA